MYSDDLFFHALQRYWQDCCLYDKELAGIVVKKIGDKGIQNFPLGRYIVGLPQHVILSIY